MNELDILYQAASQAMLTAQEHEAVAKAAKTLAEMLQPKEEPKEKKK